MSLRFNAESHQIMIGWMIRDLIDSISKSVMGSQLGREPIG
jgi:hypothetical protein